MDLESLVSLSTAVVALVLSIWSIIEVRLRSRRAEMSIRFEMCTVDQPRGERRQIERLVIKNHGPATASDVEVDVFDRGSELLNPSFLRDHQPLPRLHPGQEHHITLSTTMDEGLPEHAHMRWRDRRGRQDEQFWLSVIYV